MLQRKSLGQNFLNSPKIISDIVSAGKVERGDVVIEVGPGEGILTTALLKTGARVFSVEKDDRLMPLLKEKFAKEISSKQLFLIHADILTINLSSRVLDTGLSKTVFDNYKVVANIPYYITGQIIRMFLEEKNQPTSITLLVQKEVAERIVAKNKKESLLSLSVKVYGTPKYVMTVGRGAFKPQPNVDSAVIHISDISRKNFLAVKPPSGKGAIDEGRFFEILHAGFAHKRKQLLPNLLAIPLGSKASKWGKGDLTRVFDELGLDLKSRAEDLDLETWIKLCNTISS